MRQTLYETTRAITHAGHRLEAGSVLRLSDADRLKIESVNGAGAVRRMGRVGPSETKVAPVSVESREGESPRDFQVRVGKVAERESRKSELEAMTVDDLKDRLREADLEVSGRKAELVSRILDAGD